MTYNSVPLTPLRKVIGTRMTAAKQNIPHFRVIADIEMDALLALRNKFNDDNTDQKVSNNDFLIKACGSALLEWPGINSQLVDNELRQNTQADISVVVAVDGGLSTPVVWDAGNKTVQAIAVDVKDLAKRAALGQLKMAEISGGSFSISNLGASNVDQFDAIINPPQVAILAISTAKPQPVVKDGSVVVKTIMRVSLSLDHRAVDGVMGANFLNTLKGIIESPEGLLG